MTLKRLVSEASAFEQSDLLKMNSCTHITEWERTDGSLRP